MSRLIVKNLPTKISQEDIKQHFSQKGTVTDVKLVYKNGEFRRYGFVGFADEAAAQEACQYFNSTYIKQAKIAVEICHDLKNADKPLTWREKNKLKKQAAKEKLNKSSEKETVALEKEKSKKKKQIPQNGEDYLKPYQDDPEFKDFLNTKNKNTEDQSLLQGRDAEDSDNTDGADGDDGEDGKESPVKIAEKKEVSDLDYLKSLMVSSKSESADNKAKKKKLLLGLKEQYTVVIRTKEKCKIRQKGKINFTKQSVKDFLKPLKCKSLRIPPKSKYVAYIGFKTEREMRRALQKDKSFLNGARVRVAKHESNAGQQGEDGANSKENAPWSASEEKVKNTEPVGESGKLFVRNLWYSVTEDDLRELFEKYGKIAEISLPICKLTRRPKGFATVTFVFPEHSVLAMTDLDGTTFKGRLLHILPCRTEENDKEKENESFKAKKAREQKAAAGSWHNWNTLFLGSNTVIDIMAEKYNKSKQEILNAEGKQSVAVNLALGETQIVDEMRRFMEENGIALDAFTNPGVQRSSTVILVKNLPANTAAQELSEIFSRYGELGRVILPPAGVTGIVEYLDPGEAKKGFRSLAYTRFHSLPLYLEWAPQRVFKTEFVAKTKMETNVEAVNSEQEEVTDIKETPKNESDTKVDKQKSLPDPEENTTIYVKNLNFKTTEEVLKEHFEKMGPVHSVLIAKRRGLSQGYGFVQFVRQAHAQKTLREMQETLLEDMHLQLKLSEKTLAPQVKSSRVLHSFGKPTSTKILVKNIPFQATPKEVRQLFATFGELKTVRLPKKPNSDEHRGFGFVDFVTQDEAKKAFEALCHSTHLYGRRVVLEWAKDEESVEELRKKTADKFLAGNSRGPPLKKKKLEDSLSTRTIFDDED